LRPNTVRFSLLALAAAGALACASAPRPPVATAPAPAPVSPAAEATTAAPQPATAPGTAPRAPDAIDSGLAFSVEPAEAEIAIDGRAVGTVADLSTNGGLLRLAPGIYQVSLKATGFVTWRAEVALRSGTETIRVKLARKP
jgi:hypothetical protein